MDVKLKYLVKCITNGKLLEKLRYYIYVNNRITGDDSFDAVLSGAQRALVVFYAPWCGHCKRIKPEFERAAARVKAEKIEGVLGAVDATRYPELATRHGVRGYPTLKYYSRGQFQYEAGHVRTEDQIVAFLKEPREPPPPPPPEAPWSEEHSAVRHLDDTTFKSALRKVKHALVMFYAPWCGHCKSAKPEFTAAADRFADELLVSLAAVDCAAHAALCRAHDVTAYPALRYHSHLDRRVEPYTGDRTADAFVSFIRGKLGGDAVPESVAPSNQDAGFGPNVILATDGDFETIIGSPTPTFVMFYATWCGHCVTAKPAFSRLATAVKTDKVPVTVVAIEASDNQKAADLASIQTLPTFKMFANGKLMANYEGERSTEDMLAFCKATAPRDEL